MKEKEISMKYLNKVNEIKSLLDGGFITYDEAKEKINPILREINLEAGKIAKKHGKKARLFTISGLLR